MSNSQNTELLKAALEFFTSNFALVKGIVNWLLGTFYTKDEIEEVTKIDSIKYKTGKSALLFICIALLFIIVLLGSFTLKTIDNYRTTLEEQKLYLKSIRNLEETIKVINQTTLKLEKEVESLKLENAIILKVKAMNDQPKK